MRIRLDDKDIITVEDLNKQIKNNKKMKIIDVRIPEQYNASHIPNAINIPLKNITNQCMVLNKNEEIVVYCNGGNSGSKAQNLLLDKGFIRVYNLEGGHRKWLNFNNK
ncbi:hypothetical protein SYNTR_1482 [Candidatus Syntrophocurvum alkaliphilum]|uniref:Rhodanese domain-containing protein n=1 Tax=Candidatus Syntrophocurvum alkaliphilum TaxID=2293317 RepID=A0A6I6DBS6_9FIRM|nr:rhodanese-like domain-containing protein [Candidatus Syntrophocurvum alkaliphilum]QGU00076.1 hypothetical protein SYNTR_1482 [Candidatus Syntrophocurvum alkaliphilum]